MPAAARRRPGHRFVPQPFAPDLPVWRHTASVSFTFGDRVAVVASTKTIEQAIAGATGEVVGISAEDAPAAPVAYAVALDGHEHVWMVIADGLIAP